MDEGWLVIIAIVVGWWIVKSILAASESGKASDTSVSENEGYFGPPQLTFVDEISDETGWTIKRIMFRGLIPASRAMNVGFCISAFDQAGEDEIKPVLSLVDAAQEPETRCFQVADEFGHISPGDAFTDWVQVGVIIPDLIQPPYSGSRNIVVMFRAFDASDPPMIMAGHLIREGDQILRRDMSFTFEFSEKGYEEAAKDREESQALSIKIGVAIAMADGSLDDEEGETLKKWIQKEISIYSDSKQEELKELFNEALKEGFYQAKNGKLSLSDLTERLNEIGDTKSRYDAISLCFDVMVADGEAHPDEMATIRKVAEALDLDMSKIEEMRENVTLELSTELTSEEGLEALVGLDQDWSDEKKKKHLRKEFQTWSNRLTSLDTEEEKLNAQNMLDNIAILREKYG
jgi:tellurite resistance protein